MTHLMMGKINIQIQILIQRMMMSPLIMINWTEMSANKSKRTMGEMLIPIKMKVWSQNI
jgi:hypothetical protein